MIVKTERLILRDFVSDDWSAVLAYQSDPRYRRFYPEALPTEADARAFVQWFVDSQAVVPRRKFQLAVTLPEDGRFIGNCGVRIERPEAREASLGYELNPLYWGQGYGSEAARAMLAYGFRDLGMHRIYAECQAENTASAHIMEKLGMRQEGRMRENEWHHGRWWDSLLYAILEQDWQPSSV